jgi:hypothetical protein
MEHEVAGIALWLPPGTDITLMKMVKFGFAKLPIDTGLEQVTKQHCRVLGPKLSIASACARLMHPANVLYLQSKRWGLVANAWEAHRLAIMGDMPHWYLWAIAVVPEGSAEGARTHMAANTPSSCTRTQRLRRLKSSEYLQPLVGSCFDRHNRVTDFFHSWRVQSATRV